MDKTVCIPGPAGERQENQIKNVCSDEGGKKHMRDTTQQSLSNFHRTGLLSNVTVEVLRVFPGISEETCLLLKDDTGTIQASMTKNATSKHGTLKPGDTLSIQKVCSTECFIICRVLFPERVEQQYSLTIAGICDSFERLYSYEADLPQSRLITQRL